MQEGEGKEKGKKEGGQKGGIMGKKRTRGEGKKTDCRKKVGATTTPQGEQNKRMAQMLGEQVK